MPRRSDVVGIASLHNVSPIGTWKCVFFNRVARSVSLVTCVRERPLHTTPPLDRCHTPDGAGGVTTSRTWLSHSSYEPGSYAACRLASSHGGRAPENQGEQPDHIRDRSSYSSPHCSNSAHTIFLAVQKDR